MFHNNQNEFLTFLGNGAIMGITVHAYNTGTVYCSTKTGPW